MRVYSFSEVPYIPRVGRLHVAEFGSESERSALAYQRDLEPELALKLAGDPSERVAQGILFGASTPQALDLLVQTYPHFRPLAAKDPNASSALKLEAPLYELSGESVSNFLDDIEASDDERREMFKTYRTGTPPGGPLLGSVWK